MPCGSTGLLRGSHRDSHAVGLGTAEERTDLCVEVTPAEARAIARALLDLADTAERSGRPELPANPLPAWEEGCELDWESGADPVYLRRLADGQLWRADITITARPPEPGERGTQWRGTT